MQVYICAHSTFVSCIIANSTAVQEVNLLTLVGERLKAEVRVLDISSGYGHIGGSFFEEDARLEKVQLHVNQLNVKEKRCPSFRRQELWKDIETTRVHASSSFPTHCH